MESTKRNFQKMTEELNRMARRMVSALERAEAEGKNIPAPDMLPDVSPCVRLGQLWISGHGPRGILADSTTKYVRSKTTDT